MVKWEYRIETLVGTLLSDDVSSDVTSLTKLLNELGEEGWELVNMVPQPTSTVTFDQPSKVGVDYNHLFFKREK